MKSICHMNRLHIRDGDAVRTGMSNINTLHNALMFVLRVISSKLVESDVW